MRIGCLLLDGGLFVGRGRPGRPTTPRRHLRMPVCPRTIPACFATAPTGTLAGDPAMKNLIVTEQDLAADIHWQKGLRCHDCHGGNPVLEEYIDHRKDTDFRPVKSPAEIPSFCGRCHSDMEYMRRYNPSPRVDQVQEYWTSGHGQQLKKLADEYQQELEKLDPTAEKPEMKAVGVATCLECHTHGEKHAILAVNDQKSTVYPTHVAETCAKCHSNAELMAGRTFRGKPLGHNQYELWSQSVHGQALLKRGDLSAPTCNDCHGNHGALPPDVGSVANACGTCHVKVAKLFAETAMKHRFEQLNLPGCATCHGNHQTLSPTDMMLGMEDQAVCVNCHKDQKFGATLAGANVARELRSSLENLKQQLQVAEQTLEEAERLGMEVRGPAF